MNQAPLAGVVTSEPIDLSFAPLDDGIRIISPPQQFVGGEEEYDEHIGGAHSEDLLRSGRGAWLLATRNMDRPIADWLEIGAGSGACTLGLVAAAPFAAGLITDTSPQFLRILRRKLSAASIDSDKVQYATLAGEHMHLLPLQGFDAIFIASALHHVWDWRGFLRQAARLLRPGGVLVIQEPCREGNLMMGLALDFALSPLWPAPSAFSAIDAERLVRCRDSIYYLSSSAIVKDGEDKHSFLPNELKEAGDDAGFDRSVFYSNLHFQDITGAPDQGRRGCCSLVDYMDSFLEHHHRLSADGMSKLRAHLFPPMARLDRVFVAGDGAALLGSMVFCR